MPTSPGSRRKETWSGYRAAADRRWLRPLADGLLLRRRRPTLAGSTARSERELQRDLHDPGRGSTDDLPETGAANVSIHSGSTEELRLVENIERLESKIYRTRVSERRKVFSRATSKLAIPGP